VLAAADPAVDEGGPLTVGQRAISCFWDRRTSSRTATTNASGPSSATTPFIDGVKIRQARLRNARLALGAARARVVTPDIPPAAELRRTWADLDIPARRALLEQLIGCVFLARAPRYGRPLSDRVTICPIGTEPYDLPRNQWRGYPADKLRPIKPRREWINPSP
jgi:hypothetical protein